MPSIPINKVRKAIATLWQRMSKQSKAFFLASQYSKAVTYLNSVFPDSNIRQTRALLSSAGSYSVRLDRTSFRLLAESSAFFDRTDGLLGQYPS